MAEGNWTEGQLKVAKNVNSYIEVNGMTELVRAFRNLPKELKRELQKEIRKVAQPAADRARVLARGMQLSKKTISGIRPGSRLGMAVVRQSRKKSTGKRADFGPLQMGRVLEPAAEQTMPEAAAQLEVMLDRIADGFNN